MLIFVGGGAAIGALIGNNRKKKKQAAYEAAIEASKANTKLELEWGELEIE